MSEEMRVPGGMVPSERDFLFEHVKSHTETARVAYQSRDREVDLLKGRIIVLEQQLSQLHLENLQLKIQVRQFGGIPQADALVVR